MTTPGIDTSETIKAWADIVLKIWQAKLVELKVYDSGALMDSLLYTLLTGAGGSIEKIEFSFKLYGIFVDMGVGGEISVGNPGSVETIRKRKEWYSRVFYREVMRLKEILSEKYSEQIASSVVMAMKPVKDLKYAHSKGSI